MLTLALKISYLLHFEHNKNFLNKSEKFNTTHEGVKDRQTAKRTELNTKPEVQKDSQSSDLYFTYFTSYFKQEVNGTYTVSQFFGFGVYCRFSRFK